MISTKRTRRAKPIKPTRRAKLTMGTKRTRRTKPIR